MKTTSAWPHYTEDQMSELTALCDEYREFISRNKTERECVSTMIEMAEQAGYCSLEACLATGEALKAGDKVYRSNHGKTLMLAQIGSAPMEVGLNILGAHIDSPRLDVKQNPLDQDSGLATLDLHYYGEIKKYQWVALPLAIHGVVAKRGGEVVPVCIGEDPADPVFCITDLLPHLADAQLDLKAKDVIEGEKLDLVVANQPEGSDEEGEAVLAHVRTLLQGSLGIDERELLSAELEVVPAGPARDSGLDRSMILGYGQDDRSCAYPSLVAQLGCGAPARTCVTLLVDKEEIGSRGATSMNSNFFEDTVAELMELKGESGFVALRRCLERSRMLSSDVSAGYDSKFADVFEKKNSSYLGHGVTFNKYTGSTGKFGSNDANAEYIGELFDAMDAAGVTYQTCELGRVDAGGGGTIAHILAVYGMDVIDSGLPVLSMHAPFELTSKADIYEALRAYQAFLAMP